ncbi:MAG: serine/threonine protein kinase [Acidobacteriales bacterium]|nr:serine/threonine protein kinase [Terriglobales bacterium]
MGTVYQARDPHIDRVVAIKTISVQSAEGADDEYRQRFFREAQAAGKLAHPGIVTVHDIGEDEATRIPFIVMECIAGQTLEQTMRSAGQRLPLATTLELVKQIAEALDYAHAQGIVHRDIKPANIIVTQEGRAKITDFGVAKLTLTDYTMPGQVLGTPSYMSPEQLSGEPVTGQSDLFSLGVILYSMLTGDRPFSADTVTALTFLVVYKDPTPVTELNTTLGTEFDHVIGRALAKKPADRYQRGLELAGDLEDLSQGRAPRSMSGRPTRSVDRTQAGGVAAAAQPAPAKTPASTVAEKPTMVRGSTSFTVMQSAPLWKRWWYRPGIRWSVISTLVLIIILGGVLVRSRQASRGGAFATSYLRFSCLHDFSAAEFSVSVDGSVFLVGKLGGRRREYNQTIRVPAGDRTIRVRVVSPQDGYDQMTRISGELPGGAERTLRVVAYRGQVMRAEWITSQ